MSKDKEALEFAKKIVAINEYKLEKPDPKCFLCKGTGKVEEENGHNGDSYSTDCHCRRRNKPELQCDISPYDDELCRLAKSYLKK